MRTLSAHDSYTASHSGIVVDLALRVARTLRVPADHLLAIEHTALLHDIGKIGVPRAVLEKPGPLGEAEWVEVRRHTEIGERLVVSVPDLRHLAAAIRAGHERWDGLGYPDGLRGEEIPLASRIVSVCDAYDAMTSDRSYRKALPRGVALRELADHAGTQFCPTCVEALLAVLTLPVQLAQPGPTARECGAPELVCPSQIPGLDGIAKMPSESLTTKSL